MKLRLRADSEGRLAAIRLNDRKFGSLNELHTHILELIGGDSGPSGMLSGAEVEIDSDYGLRYENVVAAITAVSGQIAEDGTMVKLIEKIKFTPPKPE